MARAAPSPASFAPDPALALLDRFGYGPRSGEAAPRNPQAALLDQLQHYDPRPPALAATPSSAEMASRFADYLAARRAGQEAASQPQIARLRGMARDGYATAVAARLHTTLLSDTPFAERLVHFWANHLALSVDRLQTIGLAGAYEFDAIRPHILGRFEDLLLAAVRHPAMLLYLDQAQSIGPGSPLGTRAARRATQARPGGGEPRKVGLNENLAREILELHTLGVDGGYRPADVAELARGLTGWSVGGFIRRPLGEPGAPGQFQFQPAWHEPGPRTLLGHHYAPDGEAQGKAMLVALARHPATARHIASKLARHFVADAPPPTLVARLESTYLATNGDLPSLYRVLVQAPESAAGPGKFKTPWDWLVSSLRALGIDPLDPRRSVTALAELGQPAWRPGSPAGWPDTAADWAAPDALVRRVEAATRIVALAPAGLDARTLATALHPGRLSADTINALARAEDGGQALALLLVSPEFLRR